MFDNYNQDISFFMQDEVPSMLPLKIDKIVRNNNPIFYQNNSQKSINNQLNQFKSKSLNILTQNKISSKIQINQQFLDLLANDHQNSQVIIVSFIGSKGIGKSLIIDCLISYQEKSINRQMTKHPKPLINMPTKPLKGRNGQKIYLYDHNGSMNNQTFLWIYFQSSTIIFNLNPLNKNDQEDFIKTLSFLKSHLDSHPEDLTPPKLIILRRDSQGSEFNEKSFIQRIKDYDLFQNDILHININYPGSSSIKTKQIIDVPESMLNKAFINDVSNLYNLIKTTSKSKLIRGNLMGTKILSLVLDPLTRNINKDKKLNTIKIWQDVIQTLSVGYYNYYILKYSEQLQKQFQDEKPCDKYSLYKKLTSIKRRVEKKVQGFNTISDDPIFERYRQKLNEKIQYKQKMIKQINKQKSKKQNDQYCKMIFKDMNQNNCAKLIEEYCKSDLDEQKTQVLLQNFQTIINKRIQQIEKSKNNTKKLKSTQIQSLQQELKRIQLQISEQSKMNVPFKEFDLKPLEDSIKRKQQELQKLNEELKSQKQISSKKKINQNQDIIALERNIQQLKEKTQLQQQQIDKLRNDKQKKIQLMTRQLQEQLKIQQDKLAQLQSELKKKKVITNVAKPAQKGAKNNSCCQIM